MTWLVRLNYLSSHHLNIFEFVKEFYSLFSHDRLYTEVVSWIIPSLYGITSGTFIKVLPWWQTYKGFPAVFGIQHKWLAHHWGQASICTFLQKENLIQELQAAMMGQKQCNEFIHGLTTILDMVLLRMNAGLEKINTRKMYLPSVLHDTIVVWNLCLLSTLKLN